MYEETKQDKQALTDEARYQKLKKQGLCVRRCGRPSRTNRVECMQCAAKQRKIQKKRYQALKDRALCIECGVEPNWAGSVRCRQCSEDKHYYYETTKAAFATHLQIMREERDEYVV